MSSSCHFQKELPEDLDIDCPICFELLIDSPHLAVCCGRHFCGQCVSNLYQHAVQPWQSPYNNFPAPTIQCPMCKSRNCKMVLDKSLERILGNQYIYCTHWNAQDTSNGCQWEGELRHLNTHLDDSCQYVDVKCHYYDCQQVIKRYDYTEHVEKKCPHRPYTCKYCNFESTYTFITNRHYEKCSYYPMDCPLECSANMPRCEVMAHFNNDCPLVHVPCLYTEFGCQELPKRQDLTEHQTSPHHDIIIHMYNKLIKRLEKDSSCTRSILEANEKKIKELDTRIQEQFKEQEHRIDGILLSVNSIRRDFEDYKKRKKLNDVVVDIRLNELSDRLIWSIVGFGIFAVLLIIVVWCLFIGKNSDDKNILFKSTL